MDQNLVTIATFQNPLEANLAKNRLSEAGIYAVLSGEEAVSMAWFLTNAVGGVKLQVNETDAGNAAAVLEGDEPTQINLTPSATEAIQAPDGLAAAATEIRAGGEDEEEEPPRNQRELNADRACMATLLILILFVLPNPGTAFGMIIQFYLFWLLIKVYVSPEPLRSRYRIRIILALVVNIPFMIVACLVLRNLAGWIATQGR